MVCPDAGEIRMLGRDFRKQEAECKQELGVVLGGIDFYMQKRLCEITSVTKRFYRRWDDDAYQNYLRLFELEPKKKVSELSAGMRVKYLIALALSHDARLLILDEPTSGLDPVARDDLLELFQGLVKSGKRSILFSTHITSDLEKCADDITYIKNGCVLESAEKGAFLRAFAQTLACETGKPLTLEEIMVKTERKDTYAQLDL